MFLVCFILVQLSIDDKGVKSYNESGIYNTDEDGYIIVKKYVDQDYSILASLYSNKEKSATKELIEKIKANEEEIPVCPRCESCILKQCCVEIIVPTLRKTMYWFLIIDIFAGLLSILRIAETSLY